MREIYREVPNGRSSGILNVDLILGLLHEETRKKITFPYKPKKKCPEEEGKQGIVAQVTLRAIIETLFPTTENQFLFG